MTLNKIFVIGFNKCGTRTLHHFFQKNDVKSVHWMVDNMNICQIIYQNKKSDKKLLNNIDNFTVYTDMEKKTPSKMLYAFYLFKELDEQYPNSKFILNTRDINKWLISRTKHLKGKYIKISKRQHKVTTNEEMYKIWKDEWYSHHINVIEYFIDRPNDLLIFNIEEEGPEKIKNFFKDDLNLNIKYYKHRGLTRK